MFYNRKSGGFVFRKNTSAWFARIELLVCVYIKPCLNKKTKKQNAARTQPSRSTNIECHGCSGRPLSCLPVFPFRLPCPSVRPPAGLPVRSPVSPLRPPVRPCVCPSVFLPVCRFVRLCVRPSPSVRLRARMYECGHLHFCHVVTVSFRPVMSCANRHRDTHRLSRGLC
jgi:hypothetical protein